MEWLHQADSLRDRNQDAAALEVLSSAERRFTEAGDACSVALLAERRSRIHRDWKSPTHADDALTQAVQAAEGCPELREEMVGWRLAWAEIKLERRDRQRARDLFEQVAAAADDSGFQRATQWMGAEALERLAQLSLEEGEYPRSAEEHLKLAARWIKLEERERAVVALGWSGTCEALERPKRVPELWRNLPQDAAWASWPAERRMKQSVEWATVLLGGKAWATFDALSQWPWAAELAKNPQSAPPEWEAEWALLSAKRWRSSPAQSLAHAFHAELAARRIEDISVRQPMLVDALRLRSQLLAATGAFGPAYALLAETDSLMVADQRAEGAQSGWFQSEPWLAEIGDARTAMESQKARFWQGLAWAAIGVLLAMAVWMWRVGRRSSRAHRKLRRMQRQWLPGKQLQIDALAESGARIVSMTRTHTLPASLQEELQSFGRLAALCSSETEHKEVDLEAICTATFESPSLQHKVDWTLEEDVPFYGDEIQLQDFLVTLIEGVGTGGCRLKLHSRPEGLSMDFHDFTERGWWRQAMGLFAGDSRGNEWAMLRLRCDRLGGTLQLDCNASGANHLRVDLPVYSE